MAKVTQVIATPGSGPDRPCEVAYTDTKVIGNGSFGVVYQVDARSSVVFCRRRPTKNCRNNASESETKFCLRKQPNVFHICMVYA